jgi:hypothetical protein
MWFPHIGRSPATDPETLFARADAALVRRPPREVPVVSARWRVPDVGHSATATPRAGGAVWILHWTDPKPLAASRGRRPYAKCQRALGARWRVIISVAESHDRRAADLI